MTKRKTYVEKVQEPLEVYWFPYREDLVKCKDKEFEAKEKAIQKAQVEVQKAQEDIQAQVDVAVKRQLSAEKSAYENEVHDEIKRVIEEEIADETNGGFDSDYN